MKAAVLHKFGETPKFEDFPDPPIEQGQLLVHVKAVALENIDKALAAGSHFAAKQMLPQLPAIVGLDGIGRLDDGRLVGFGGLKSPYGALAEKTVIQEGYYVPIPDGVDAVIAAALPASALTALFPLKWGAKLQPGETVLINGATGVTGILAIQIAKYLGAGRIVCTGRHAETLNSLRPLGADAIIDLKLADDQLAQSLAEEAKKGFDVILDCLWGHPTDMIIRSLVPHQLGFATRRVRLIQVGEMAGSTISLPADSLRTSGLEIIGASAGLTPEAIAEGTSMVWELLRDGKLHLDIVEVPLKEIESAWQRTDLHGKRIVIVP
jgi:NADPH:quinone reductase-like Zn-dependent oxidoreductase